MLKMSVRLKSNHVFINCPFDPGYRPIFSAIVFTVYNLRFVARCALEEEDAGEFRLSKVERIIEECKFGINDLSAVAVDTATGLPRFNMPLELGLFLGCKRFGPDNQSKKRCLVLDSDRLPRAPAISWRFEPPIRLRNDMIPEMPSPGFRCLLQTLLILGAIVNLQTVWALINTAFHSVQPRDQVQPRPGKLSSDLLEAKRSRGFVILGPKFSLRHDPYR